MYRGHSVDYVLGKVIACFEDFCDQLTPSGWSSFSSNVEYRSGHISSPPLYNVGKALPVL